MIFLAAPGYAANMVFAGAPSGTVYQSNQFGLIYVGSGGVPDQLFLQAAGCATLVPFGDYQPPPLSAWKLAATGCSISTANGLTSGTYLNKSVMSVISRCATAPMSGVAKLVYPNWTAQSGAGDYYGPDFGAITATCSVAYPTKGDIIGTGSFTVQPGQNAVVAIALSTPIPAGAQFFIGTYAVPASGCGIPLFNVPYSEGLNTTAAEFLNAAAGEAGNIGTSGVTDQTANLAAVTTPSGAQNTPLLWGPSAILSLQPASAPVACVFSDSRNFNFYYDTDGLGDIGWFAQALGAVGIPVVSFAGAGKSAGIDAGSIINPCPLQGQPAITLRKQFCTLIGVTDAYIDLGINDMGDAGPIGGDATAATVQGNWATIIDQLQAIGLRITVGTLLPITTSTDDWDTTANQTLSPNNAQMDIFNAWVRAKPLGAAFLVDGGAAVGTGLTSAKWTVGAGGSAPWTADGIHPYDRALNNLVGAVVTANYTAFLPSTGLGYADTWGRGLKNVQGALDFALNPENMGHDILLGSLVGANFNTTADQAIALNGPSAFVITNILVANPSTSLSAAQGGFYAAGSKAAPLLGTTTTTAFSALTDSPPISGLIQAIAFGGTAGVSYKMAGNASIYLSLTAPQGAPAMADVYVFGKKVTP